jgi:membrane protein YqaA with SNARE-associated domain
MKKINIWSLFIASVILLPIIMVICIYYGWVLAWCGFCLLICIAYEIYHKIKNKKIKK